MTCHNCQSACKRFGRHRNGLQRFRCRQCKKTFTEEHEKPLDEMRLPVNRAVNVLQLLLEGMSVRSVERVTGIHRDTILRLLTLAGERCQRLMHERIKEIEVRDVQADEIWGYVYKKEGHKWEHEKTVQQIGDCWCYAAIERETKLILAYHIGKRDVPSTDKFIYKLALATGQGRYQLTTDGWKAYVRAVQIYLGSRVHFAQLVKVYGASREGEQRCSPAEVVDAVPSIVSGNPDRDRICTSHVERQNLSIRMGMRRMTRLTNGFSKKWENLEAAYALWFAYYNFCRRHQTLRVTPAMEQGLTDNVWTVGELVGI
ncbi:DDE superfamily endonuclease [Acidipila rosea]|uniref:DDE superfamily endonuclease n=1 Tax=Acidipila rosea TaxID=768535 RepID=A0A4R1LGZ3_9BACT|nr:DDE superfamily endonuclease [Acidipila rosea]